MWYQTYYLKARGLLRLFTILLLPYWIFLWELFFNILFLAAMTYSIFYLLESARKCLEILGSIKENPYSASLSGREWIMLVAANDGILNDPSR